MIDFTNHEVVFFSLKVSSCFIENRIGTDGPGINPWNKHAGQFRAFGWGVRRPILRLHGELFNLRFQYLKNVNSVSEFDDNWISVEPRIWRGYV